MPENHIGEDEEVMHRVTALGDLGVRHATDAEAARAIEARLRRGRNHGAGFSVKRGGGLLAVGASLLLGAGVAAAATGVWDPVMGSDEVGHPSVADGPVPDAQLKRFSVLARQPTATDRGADVQAAIRYFGSTVHGIRTNSIRRLDVRPGGDGGRTALLVSLSERDGVRDPLCLYTSDSRDGDGGSKGCWSTDQILRGEAVLGEETPDNASVGRTRRPQGVRTPPAAATPPRAAENNSAGSTGTVATVPSEFGHVDAGEAVERRVFGLVPDGVSTVEWSVGGAVKRRSVVKNNYFTMTRKVTSREPGSPKIVWLDNNGRIVRVARSVL